MSEHPKTDALAARRAGAIPKGPTNLTPLFVSRASGAMIFDVDGREYIDFAGGIGVMNVGHSHPKVVAAIKAQAEAFTHTCFHVVMYEPYVELAEKLCAIAPGDFAKSAIFANSGAEAVENAVKVARHFTGRQGIICLENGFHGRTYMGMTLTSKVKPYKFGFGPFCPEVYRIPAPYCYRCPFGLAYPGCGVECAGHLREFFIGNVAAENTAALIVEPVMGEGGFITGPPEYLPKLQAICRENGIVFVADEIQSGMGRTGKMLAVEHWGVEPDVVTVAKSLAAGMPLSAIIGRADIMNSAQVGGLGGTYGGNPVACKAALAVLELLREGLLARSVDLGLKLRSRFDGLREKYPVVGDVRGLGPMLALELVLDRQTKEPATAETKALAKFCLERGLIVLTCGHFGNVVRTLMPLVITDEQLERGLAILEEGLAAIGR